MKHIKKLNESNSIHSRLSQEDLDDYLLEFIDSKDLWLIGSSIRNGSDCISTRYNLNDKFKVTSNYDDMIKLSKMLEKIAEVCKRWNLNWKFNMCADSGPVPRPQLEILQTLPKAILDHMAMLHGSEIKFYYDYDQEYKFNITLQNDNDLNFYITCDVNTLYPSRWVKSDRTFFDDNEMAIINQLIKKFPIKCEYDHKSVDRSDLHFGQKRYKYIIKLLV